MDCISQKFSVSSSLIRMQEQIERKSAKQGLKRLRDRVFKAEQAKRCTETPAGTRLLRNVIDPLSKRISEFVICQDKRSLKKQSIKWIKLVGIDVTAYLTAKAVINGLTKQVPLIQAAVQISNWLFDEVKFSRLSEEAPGLFASRINKLNTANYTHKKHNLNQACNYVGIVEDDLQMTDNEKVHVGIQLINCLVGSTGLVEITSALDAQQRTKKQGYKQAKYLVATDKALKWFKGCNDYFGFLHPKYMPLVVPPKPWTTPYDGGYWFNLAGTFPLLRTNYSKHNETQLKLMEQANLTLVYAAVNRLQETPWCINEKVMEVLEYAASLNRPVCGLPGATEIELPAKPYDIETNEQARTEWRHKAHMVHEENHKRKTKVIQFAELLSIAREMRNFERFWFPYTVDFRGRIYSASVPFLNPQGGDIAKGLLTFAEKKAVDTDDYNTRLWFANHGACLICDSPFPDEEGLKVDKLPLRKRLEWVEKHNADIISVSDDPWSNTWWQRADEGDAAWQFLAWCFEWADYVRTPKGSIFYSNLPIHVDGSCNGLQHFSAALRDPEGGSAVNLRKSSIDDYPQDIYTKVADVVKRKVTDIAKFGEPIDQKYATDWLNSELINRKLCKRPTMTMPYGSKLFGIKFQLLDVLKKLKAMPDWTEIDKETGEERHATYLFHCLWLGKVIHSALGEAMPSARQCMDWLQDTAKLITKSEGDFPIYWTAPSGFPVLQAYSKMTTKQIVTKLNGQIFKPRLQEETDVFDGSKQANGIAPNVVHSWDAAALCFTVKELNQCIENLSFTAVHDSFGTHLSNITLLTEKLRYAFVGMYVDNDVFPDLVHELVSQLDEKQHENIKLPPPKDNGLNLCEVLDSPYFFA